MLSEMEGITPALETAHAVWGAVELAKTMKKDQDIVICVSGRGYVYFPQRISRSTDLYSSDKDVESVAEELPRLGPKIGWDLRF
jgi:tryptophan synthase